MNKELINKYKPEFDHWLNGGEILKASYDFEDSKMSAWYKVECNENWNFSNVYDYRFIINDEYSIYRKALAEGKAIEYLGQSSNTWHELPEPNFVLHPTCYRIKPDEPKFKVGDFVIYVHSTLAKALEINNINGNRYYFTNSEMSCLEHELEPWTPVKGEWCWFYDSKSSKSSYLAEFKQMSRQFFESEEIGIYDYCEPFLNSLPSYLKDK